jgi:ribonuclease D
MIAAQLCGREQVGLAALLEEFFGLKLDKRYQKANWNQRPLQPGMLEYAALDTAHLLPLKEQLEQELVSLGRKAWAEEEFRLLEAAEPAPSRPPSCFDVKGSRRLAPQQLAILQALLEVREKAAAEWDRPPFKVLNNAVLTAWALAPPRGRSELLSASGANQGVLGRLANQLLGAVRGAQALPLDQCPRATSNGSYEPLTPAQEKRLKRLKKARSRCAEKLQLPMGLLVNTATLERLARCPSTELGSALDENLKTWQHQILGEDLLAAAAG